MNIDNSNKLVNPAFEKLFTELYATHKPIKPVIKDDILILIGKVIVKFQRLEMTIGDFISTLLNFNSSFGNILTNDLSFKNLLSLLGTLHYEIIENSTEIEILLKEARKAEELRNQIVHSIWLYGQTGATRWKKSNNNGKGKKVIFEEFSVGELEKIVDWIDKIDTSFGALKFKELIKTEL